MQNSQPQCWQLNVFTAKAANGDRLAGNPLRLQFFAQGLPESDALQSLAAKNDCQTSCFFARNTAQQCIDVVCFNPQSVIQCCGHGLLACAYLVNDLLKLCWPLRQHNQLVTVEQWPQGPAIALPRLACRDIELPQWCGELLQVQPLKAAQAGGEQGYLLLQFASYQQLLALQPRFSQFSRYTARAIIATCAGRPGYDKHTDAFCLRYFAPQYGVNEDAVTGSAMRIAADFWAQQTAGEDFIAQQLSAPGGLAALRVDSDRIWLQGEVECSNFSG